MKNSHCCIERHIQDKVIQLQNKVINNDNQGNASYDKISGVGENVNCTISS